MNKDECKVLFMNKEYEKIIAILKKQFVLLFQKMLDFKNVEYDKKNDYFSYVIAKLDSAYDQYVDYTIVISNSLMDPDVSTIDELNILLDYYKFFQDEYKEMQKQKQ